MAAARSTSASSRRCCAIPTRRRRTRRSSCSCRAKHPDTMQHLVEVLKDENEGRAPRRRRGAERRRRRRARQVPAAGHQGRRLVGAQPRGGRARQDRRPAGHRRRRSSCPRQGRGSPPRGDRDPEPDQGRARRRLPDRGHQGQGLVGQRARRRCARRDRQQEGGAAAGRDAERRATKSLPTVVRALGKIGDAAATEGVLGASTAPRPTSASRPSRRSRGSPTTSAIDAVRAKILPFSDAHATRRWPGAANRAHRGARQPLRHVVGRWRRRAR